MSSLQWLQWLRWLVLFLMRSANEYKGSNVEFTFPGTNWCGPGNTSLHENHLGFLAKTDNCCREHDHCPLSISANQTKYGLHNDLPYTSSNCACDNAFYKCLHNVQSTMPDTLSSALIGNIYFTFLQGRCFQKKPPNTDCQMHRNTHTQDCLISWSNESAKFDWKTMPPFK